MSFFDLLHKEIRREKDFGLCDDGKLAYTELNAENKWIAKVQNKNQSEVCFVPLDHNSDWGNDKSEEPSLCDCMLYLTERWLAFIELKEVRKDFVLHASKQLKSTISIFKEKDPDKAFDIREAYIANRKHPSFAFSHKEECQKFKNEMNFRLIISNEILVRN